ncbi:MAG: ATP-binding protein [Candidatus Uhrbacteria bacterium]|nr:ATP-binding protein [Candidatus Uhrbacteria bacterium]
MFQWITLLEFFTFLAGAIIGIYVLSRDSKNPIHQALAVAALAMAGWNLSIFLLLNHLVPPLFPAYLSFSFGALVIASFSWFVFLFPRPIRFYKRITIFSWILGLIFIILPFIPAFLVNPEIVEGHIVADFNPTLLGLWTLYYTGYFIVILILLLVRTLKTQGVDRSRMWLMITGFLLYFIPSVITNLLLPVLFNDWRFNNLGPVFTIFPVIMLSYSVLKYRLMNMRWIFGKGVIYSLLVGVTLWIIVGTLFLLSSLVKTELSIFIAVAGVVFLYRPLYQWLNKILSKLMHGGRYNPEEVARGIFDDARSTVELKELVDLITASLYECFLPSEYSFIAFRPRSTDILYSKDVGMHIQSRYLKDIIETIKTNKYGIVEVNELDWQVKFGKDNKIKRRAGKQLVALRDAGINVAIPFTIDSRVVALFILGERKVDKVLYKDDVQFLDMIRSAVAPAIENAAKYAEIKHLYDELASLDKVKSEFIGVVSHRFRTPLSAIRWNLEAVLDTYGKSLSKEAKEGLHDAHDRSLFLISTLDRLFDSIAIERGTFKVKGDTFSARTAFEPVLQKFQEKCTRRNIKCSFKISPIKMFGDEQRLVSVCDSIISNALQYTPKGEVKFDVSKEGNNVRITVSDTGIGIPKNDLDKIWDKFYRAKNAILTYTDGQGLGLYLAKVIVDSHKGHISVDTEVGKGTTFTITLPGKSKKHSVAKK